MLDLMEVRNELQVARSKARFLELLACIPAGADVVHIATHGRTEKTRDGKPGKFVAFWTPDEKDVTIAEIAAAGINLPGKIVISTACLSGQKGPRKR